MIIQTREITVKDVEDAVRDGRLTDEDLERLETAESLRERNFGLFDKVLYDEIALKVGAAVEISEKDIKIYKALSKMRR